MAYLGKIEQLKTLVSSAFRQGAEAEAEAAAEQRLDGFKESVQTILGESADVASDLEIVFRSVLGGLLSCAETASASAAATRAGAGAGANMDTDADRDDVDVDADVVAFLTFSFDFTTRHHKLGALLAKMPYLLLEDVLESQTIQVRGYINIVFIYYYRVYILLYIRCPTSY
jgi:hypothetical protein